jgi:hypothetical protein
MNDVGWTTRLDPKLTSAYGVAELHSVYFEPLDWNVTRPVVTLGIPECELHFASLIKTDEPLVMINRPVANRNVKYWLRHACQLATEGRAYLSFTCDTAEQAEQAAKRAAKLLPKHRRVALERLYEVTSRERGRLS